MPQRRHQHSAASTSSRLPSMSVEHGNPRKLPTPPPKPLSPNTRNGPLMCVPTWDMAVVPFVPSWPGGAAVGDGALMSAPLALSMQRVCPTCLRPLNAGFGELSEEASDAEDDGEAPLAASGGGVRGDGDGGPRVWRAPNKRLLAPQYFRALAKALPLCIGDSTLAESALPHLHSPAVAAPDHPPKYGSPSDSDTPEDWGGPEAVMQTVAYHQQQQPTGGGGGDPSADYDGDCLNGYYARYFSEVRKLGSGTYGGVYLCQHVMEGVPLGTFALKKIPVGDNTPYLQKVLHEVRILEEVKRHPNVVEYNHSWVEVAQVADFGPPVRCLFILMEHATEGSLDAYLERHGRVLPTIAVWYFFLSAVAGTAHLHRKSILHRDLKPQNLLLTGPPGKVPRVLVSDFGTAALLDELGYERTGATGTLEYMAPELLEHAPDTAARSESYANHHTKASDVWSLGMILYYLACNGILPSYQPDGSIILNVQAYSPYPRPPEMVELIRAMLQRNPNQRPSCKDILQSPVAQSILRSFANQSEDATVSLYPDYFASPQPQKFIQEGSDAESEGDKRHGPRQRGGDGPYDHREEEDMEKTLQSSRVELISTSAAMHLPLSMLGSPNLRTQHSPKLLPHHRPASAVSSGVTPLETAFPHPRRRHVDAAVQTDIVHFLNS